MMKIPLLRCCSLLGVILIAAPLRADNPNEPLNKALSLLRQAEHPAGASVTDAQRIDWLKQAVKSTIAEPNHRLQGYRVLAVQTMRRAIADIQNGDPSHLEAADFQTAETELQASIALVKSNHAQATAPTANPPPPTPAAPPLAPPPDAATPSAEPASTTPAAPAADFVPPGVTSEMEHDFLTRYEAALKITDKPDAILALVANDPKIDSDALEAFKGLSVFAIGMETSNPHRTHSFVPLPSDHQNKLTPMKGKMYDAYLPPVVDFKTTFGKPDKQPSDQLVPTGEHVLPLCVQNNKLMIDGVKVVPGAVPPPAGIDKAANFGIEPNLQKVNEKAPNLDKDGFPDNGFRSLNEFLASLKQPAVQVLASGDTTYEYYAICRIAPNLCVWAGGDKIGAKNFSFYFRATDATRQQLPGAKKWIRLVDTPTDDGQAPDVQGTVFYVPTNYSGSIDIEANYTDDASGKTENVTRPVDWK